MISFKNQKGGTLIYVLVFASIAITFLGSLVSWATLNIRAGKQAIEREIAIQIAESGTDYYRWHLAHSPEDYQDGTGEDGPYVHSVDDKDGNIVGYFTLNITPPDLGSTLVTIKSSGKSITNPNISRSITTRLAKPSIAKYAVAANSAIRFGPGTEVFGPITSSGGIRFDGLAHNIISSAVAEYDDPDHEGGNEFGVHTHATPIDTLPPNEIPQRLDIFEAGRQFPVPAIDFDGITANISQMKIDAQSDGFYRADSGAVGYHMTLQTNDTFDLYQVTSMTSPPSNCSNSWQDGWSTWSVSSESFLGNFNIPENGIVFIEDHLFIDGQIDTAKINIIAAFFPENPTTWKNIIINNDLLYTNYDGSDSIGLIAQGNINAGLISEDNLRIDAALIAQNGRVGRYYYPSSCSSYYIRDTITLFGMMATSKRYGFAYTNSNDNKFGYEIRNLIYDANMLYNPPPSFPLTSEQYETLSWQETK